MASTFSPYWNLSGASRLPRGSTPCRQLFVEEGGPARAYGVHQTYAPVEKTEIAVENPYGLGSLWLSSIVRLDCGTYRCYGTTRTTDQRTQAIGVWESDDGLRWSARPLGQIACDGRDTNLIHFDGIPGDQSAVAWPQIVRLRDGRWRMYFWKHREGHLRYTVAESEDGLRWSVPDFERPALFHPHDGGLLKLAEGLSVHEMVSRSFPPEEVLRRKRLWSNDATYVYYNHYVDRFECYTVWLHPAIPDRRVEVDNAPGVHRLIQRRFSEDGIDWSDAELILWPDDRDPWDLQFYFLGVQWHRDWMVGMLGYYRVEDGQQTMDTDLCFSRDGYRWHRPVRGGWIPRAPEGSEAADTKGVYAGGPWIDLGDRWLTIYQGTPLPHNAKKFESHTMGATFAKDRFVGVAAGRVPGGFMTEPIFAVGDNVRVDADVRGWLRAELCDVFGRKLAGFHLADSIPVSGCSGVHVLRWRDARVADHRFECVRLRFEFSDAEVYGVVVADPD
jgi:hypothetical protein